MKKFLKALINSILITILIFVMAIAAAPFFVREEQVRNFVQKHITLPEGDKLVIDGKIQFALLPKMYLKAEKAKVVKADGVTENYSDMYLGFNSFDIFGRKITFDIAFKKGDFVFDGHISVEDYNALIRNKPSLVTMDIEKPLPLKVRGNLSRADSRTYQLNDFRISHKQSLATGNLKVVSDEEGLYHAKLDTVIESSNLDDIRRLIDFANYNDDFNQISGSGTLNLNIEASGKNPKEMRNTINGFGDLNIHGAEIYGIDLNEIIGKKGGTELKERNDIKLIILKGYSKFDIANSVVNISDLTANNNLAQIEGKGIIDIVKRYLKIDTDVHANLFYVQAEIPLTAAGNFDDIRFISRSATGAAEENKVNLKNVKINLDPKNMKNNLESLKDIGKSFGFDLKKLKIKKHDEPAAPSSEGQAQ